MANFEKIEFAFSKTKDEFVDLWFWDWAHGRDVVGVVLNDGTVRVNKYDDADIIGFEIITIMEFLSRIKNSIDQRDEQYR